MKVNTIRLLLLAIILIGVGVAISYRSQFEPAAIERSVRGTGTAAPLIFMAIYAFGTLLFLPGSVMTLAGGALFGPFIGTICNLGGATAGATLAFLTARYLASDWVRRKAGGLLRQIIEGVESEGWRFVAFVRLVPVFPFNLLNYALGLTRIKLSHYIIASFFCMVPGAFAYTYIGYTGREAFGGREGMIKNILIALGLVALIIFIPRFMKRLRTPLISPSELKHRLDNGDDFLILDVRGSDEFSGELGHIHGAINIPVADLSNHIGNLNAYRNKRIICVCHTDKRSSRAAGILRDAGFTAVMIVKGGMVQWRRYNLPVER